MRFYLLCWASLSRCDRLLALNPACLSMMLYCRRKIDFPIDPLTVFEPLAHQPWAMLLDSATAAVPHSDAHFDIIVADPIATLMTQEGTTEICTPKTKYQSLQDPLTLLQQVLFDQLGEQLEIDTDLPFVGGALGHFSYDLGRYFERLPTWAQDDIQLPDMAVGIYDWALIIDNRAQGVELVVLGNELAWQRRYNWLIGQQHHSGKQFALTSPWQHQLSIQQYQDKFKKIQAYLASGDCYQINLTQRFSAQYEGEEWLAYKALRQHNLSPFSAFIRLPNATLLSLSPERFLQVKDQQIATKPIKGTRPRSVDPIRDKQQAIELQQAPKDRAENLMIVDLLRNDLGRVAAPGTVQVPSLFAIESFPAVHHLVSTVTATLSGSLTAVDLLRSAFPGGSITGAPKIRAMEIIEELEPHRRSLYCGSIGYLSHHGHMDTSIAIRTLVAKQGLIHCWAGGGIVADSDCASEYQETFDKLSRILPCLSEPLSE